ncbi:MAG: carboxylating nicotinate-nucleotide diphosphorylase [Chloroflexi bacterium]|nr:carboxylating nicotinate-nucleotide diphosphorylase [Chloroflexota bacterium]
MKLSVSRIKTVVARALEEDLGLGDVTTEALISPAQEGKASFLVKSRGTLAGIYVSQIVFEEVDPTIRFEVMIPDGMKVEPGDIVATVHGKVASILRAERVALNFLQRMSGIATETTKYVEAVAGTKAAILDTRKTTPGLRLFEKYAVKMGGGQNHRQNLAEQVLIKDNHLAALKLSGVSLGEAIKVARAKVPRDLKIEVEVTTIKQFREALDAGADIIMLDNMGVREMRRAVKMAEGKVPIEASGGIGLDNVRAVAETGVDFISIGALTHSARALDISLEIVFGK